MSDGVYFVNADRRIRGQALRDPDGQIVAPRVNTTTVLHSSPSRGLSGASPISSAGGSSIGKG
jgi:hypothetical protein